MAQARRSNVDIDPDKHFYHQYNNFGNKYYLEDDLTSC